MTEKNVSDRKGLGRLADALVQDILDASDEEMLAEFLDEGGKAERNADEMRVLFEQSLLIANKQRMASAKAGAAATKVNKGISITIPVDIRDARALLHSVIERSKGVEMLTMAARKESELSDSDVRGMLENLAELGLLDSETDEGNR